MGYVGWGTVTDQTNTSTGGAITVVADVTASLSTGFGVGGSGVINTFSGAPPVPPPITGFLLLETGLENFLLQETGTPPTRIQLE
jgi:hypothetical protein